ncbi:MAG: TraB/GumN family protein [Candidatus Nanohaloarchaea archaeon]|nr:TraB/GumN family protein [Candidatus Nanohaloarchaea archaeon]
MQERITVDGTDIVLLGTAHVSDESVGEVNSVIREEEPDTVAVELDQDRFEALVNDLGWAEMDVSQALKEGKGAMLLANVLLSVYQRKLGDHLDMDPGADMLAAVNAADTAGVPVTMIDRDIGATLRSALDTLTVWEKGRLFTELVLSMFSGGTISEEDIEELKEQDVLTAAVDELGAAYPGIKHAFIDERDVYMAEQLRQIDADTVVAVVGAAHVDGIKQALTAQHPVPRTTSETGGRGFPIIPVFKYGVPALIVGMLAYIFLFVGVAAGSQAFAVWFLLNGVLAAAGAVVARSHPATVLASFLAAPFTSINPALPSGLVAAYVEARFDPPQVKDLEAVGDVASLDAFWSNTALNLVLVFMLVNVGSSIASYLGAGYLAQIIV